MTTIEKIVDVCLYGDIHEEPWGNHAELRGIRVNDYWGDDTDVEAETRLSIAATLLKMSKAGEL